MENQRESKLETIFNKFNFTKIKFYDLKQFVKFCLIGLINTVIDFSIFFGLTRVFEFFSNHYLFANIFAFFFANLFSFIANKHWTFSNKSTKYTSQYAKFLIVSLFSLLLVQLTLYLSISVFGVWDVYAKIVALFVSVIINYFGSRFWAFK